MTATDNGEQMILWIGGSVSPKLLRDLYGVESPHDLSATKVKRRFFLDVLRHLKLTL
jgi:hypothetical protein